MEISCIGVSKHLLLEPTKSPGGHAGQAAAASVLLVLAQLSRQQQRGFCSNTQKHTENQHLPTPRSGLWELLLQHFSEACEVTRRSSFRCPLTEGDLINYVTLSQLSPLGENINTAAFLPN